jgi:SAM-dependent methyltransferase
MTGKGARGAIRSGELDLDDILDISWGWRPSILLLQAHSAGIFDAASGGWHTADQIAGKLDTDIRATSLLLDGLSGVGLIKKSGDKYKNGEAVERHLVRSAPEYKGSILELDKRSVTNWLKIGEVVKSGEPIPKPETNDEEKKAWQETFILAMDDLAGQFTDRMLDALPLQNGMRILDIGCGPATYLVGAALRFKNLTAVAFDRPMSEGVVAKAVEKAGVKERIEFKGGDFTTDDFDFGDAFDGILISQIIHIIDRESSADLIKRAVNVVKPGGFVAVHEMTLGPDDDPGPAAVFSIQMMLGTKSGGVYTKQEIEGWMKEAGLAIESDARMGARSEVIVGRKPKARAQKCSHAGLG